MASFFNTNTAFVNEMLSYQEPQIDVQISKVLIITQNIIIEHLIYMKNYLLWVK